MLWTNLQNTEMARWNTSLFEVLVQEHLRTVVGSWEMETGDRGGRSGEKKIWLICSKCWQWENCSNSREIEKSLPESQRLERFLSLLSPLLLLSRPRERSRSLLCRSRPEWWKEQWWPMNGREVWKGKLSLNRGQQNTVSLEIQWIELSTLLEIMKCTWKCKSWLPADSFIVKWTQELWF